MVLFKGKNIQFYQIIFVRVYQVKLYIPYNRPSTFNRTECNRIKNLMKVFIRNSPLTENFIFCCDVVDF